MSKSIEDYRNIVKVLKLQLLKVREENNTLSKNLGISSETQTSSFSNRLEKFKANHKQFAKHIYLFTLYAHKCEIIGVTPEMVFRIADKKRDKKISVTSLEEIMKRLKLKLDNIEIDKITRSITKSSHILYDEYLQYMCAFQINSQKYPYKSKRSYSQICMLKFGAEAKQKHKRAEELYRAINSENNPYLGFEEFSQHCRKYPLMKQAEIIAVFTALDLQGQCQIERETFTREMGNIFNLIDRGVSYTDDANIAQNDEQVAMRPERTSKNESDDDMKLEEDTGVEKGNKQVKKPTKKQPPPVMKGEIGKLVNQMKAQGLRINNIIAKLLEKDDKRKLVKPFSLMGFLEAINSINKKCEKKKVMNFFRAMDQSNNGSISTDELIKLWLDGREISDPAEMLYKLLARHLKEIQCPDLISRFTTLGYQPEQLISFAILQDVFENLKLEDDYIKKIESYIQQKSTIQDFIGTLETGGVGKTRKVFKPMKKAQFQNMNVTIKKLIPKEKCTFEKLSRMGDEDGKHWNTIFTNEWACWNYCLQTASKLEEFWRDPDFGPSKGDPHGYRSIVANQSQVPPGLPFEQEISWVTFEQILQRQNNTKDEVKLFKENLSANDIIQGKLGDCWFVSSLSIVSRDDSYIKGKPLKQCQVQVENLTYGIHPIIFHGFAKYGLYVFKFFKKFKPIYVVVDDLFPIEESSGDLIFAKSPQPGLQWVAFLEKAFAKLHHAYSNLISGDIAQGLCDMINCIPIKEDINNDNYQEMLEKLRQLDEQKQLMGCSITAPKGARVEQPVELDGQRCGLFYSHAYSIGDVINLKTKEQDYDLIRVRNPWGHGEWCLDWSDNPQDPDYQTLKNNKKFLDDYYNKKIKELQKMRVKKDEMPQRYEPGDDGQFIMSVKNFSEIFTNLFTGFSFKEKFVCQYIHDAWDSQMPSGVCKAKGASQEQMRKFVNDNHQYILDLNSETQILMTLTQQDGRLYRGEKYPYKQICNGIIIFIFGLESNESSLKKFDMTKMKFKNLKFQLRREVNEWHKFSKGRYAIIPCKLPNKIKKTQFEFRVYSEETVSIKKANGKGQFKIEAKKAKSQSPGAITAMLETIDKF